MYHCLLRITAQLLPLAAQLLALCIRPRATANTEPPTPHPYHTVELCLCCCRCCLSAAVLTSDLAVPGGPISRMCSRHIAASINRRTCSITTTTTAATSSETIVAGCTELQEQPTPLSYGLALVYQLIGAVSSSSSSKHSPVYVGSTDPSKNPRVLQFHKKPSVQQPTKIPWT